MKQKGLTRNAAFLLTGLSLLAAGGWVANVVKIVGTMDNPMTGLFIARCIGAFIAPIGAVLGYV